MSASELPKFDTVSEPVAAGDGVEHSVKQALTPDELKLVEMYEKKQRAVFVAIGDVHLADSYMRAASNISMHYVPNKPGRFFIFISGQPKSGDFPSEIPYTRQQIQALLNRTGN